MRKVKNEIPTQKIWKMCRVKNEILPPEGMKYPPKNMKNAWGKEWNTHLENMRNAQGKEWNTHLENMKNAQGKE